MKLHKDVTHKHSINSFSKLADKFSAAHGDKYDYSKVLFINGATKVTIICPEHGEFEQTPTGHIRGQGCRKCSDSNRTGLKLRVPFSEFVAKATITHKSKYTYLKSTYAGTDSKLSIICPIHGEFLQVGYSHLKGHGCTKCRRLYNTDSFIKKASVVHKDKFKYPNTLYTKWDDKIRIECPTHGEFEQEAHTHLRGHGCPYCAVRGFDTNKPGILYYIKFGEVYKLGITNNSVAQRYNKTLLANAEILLELELQCGKTCHSLEQQLLKDFKDLLYVGEPLLPDGNTELFTENIINHIKEYYDKTQQAV